MQRVSIAPAKRSFSDLMPCSTGIDIISWHDYHEGWLADASDNEARLEAGARRFAMTLGRTVSLALLARHAQWALEHERSRRPLAAAKRYAAHGINLLAEMDGDEARMLARDEPGAANPPPSRASA